MSTLCIFFGKSKGKAVKIYDDKFLGHPQKPLNSMNSFIQWVLFHKVMN